MNEQTPTRSDPRRDVVAWLQSGHIEAEMKRALPDHLPVDWFLRCAQTALLNNPNLASADKASLLRELVSVAQLGLVLDPQLGEAWLIIDRHGKVQRRVGYQGLRKLVLQSGQVTGLNAQAVYRADTCEITLGDSPSVQHKVNLDVGDRGEIIGYYAVGKVVGTTEPVVEWMSRRQIEDHRDRYSDAYKGQERAMGRSAWRGRDGPQDGVPPAGEVVAEVPAAGRRPEPRGPRRHARRHAWGRSCDASGTVR